MDSTGEFHVVEKNGNLFLVYHHPKYDSIPQTQSLTSSGEAASSDDYFLHPLFVCPIARLRQGHAFWYVRSRITSSYEYFSTRRNGTSFYHYVLPLFWCNNKEFDVNGGCNVCHGSNFGTNYYFCDYCDEIYHKECVQSPSKIKHPYHPDHSLKLYFLEAQNNECLSCMRSVGKIYNKSLVYSCTICEVFIHPICAMKMIPFTVNQPKRHDHSLSFFPRQTSLTCNVCGLLRKIYPTYICVRCNFVAHNDCMYSPRIIKISRHNHRISYISYLPSNEWFCGVCRQSINDNYGAYTCYTCSDYAVHLRCALGKDVWDGEDLEDVLEKDDMTQDVRPFDVVSKGVILYFLHNHRLQLEVSILYDESKLCEACALPIYEGNSYSCEKCDFVLHEKCANAPRIIQHALHPHPLTLKHVSRYDSSIYNYGLFICNACGRFCCGFVYECHIGECTFDLDVRCAFISEPFDYKGHRHPLFLALDPKEKHICLVCNEECLKQFNCIECNFIVCLKCATLPNKARHKHDKHFLRIVWREEVCENDWCEVCEHDLGNTKVFYCCDECCTTLHIECLVGEDPYMKPGQCFELSNKEVQILRKRSNISRPLCGRCKNYCKGKLFKKGNITACSLKCVR